MRSTKYPETPVFVPNGDSQEETAVLLVGTAKEYGLSNRSVRASMGGFWISEALADLVYGEAEPEAAATVTPAEAVEAEPVEPAEAVEAEAVTPAEPETVEPVEPEAKKPVKRSTKKKTSGNRAEKTDNTVNTDKE